MKSDSILTTQSEFTKQNSERYDRIFNLFLDYYYKNILNKNKLKNFDKLRDEFFEAIKFIDIKYKDFLPLDAVFSSLKETVQEYASHRFLMLDMLKKSLDVSIKQESFQFKKFNGKNIKTDWIEPLTKSPKNLHNQVTNLGIYGKFILFNDKKYQMVNNEWLADEDLERIVKKLNLENEIRITSLYPEENLKEIIYHAQKYYTQKNKSIIDEPYTIYLIVNNGNEKNQGTHWSTLAITYNPNNTIDVRYVDSLSGLNFLTKSFFEKHLSRVLKSDRNETINFNYADDQGFIKQKDGWSCGYLSLKNLLYLMNKNESKDTLKNNKLAQQILQCSTNLDVRDLVYSMIINEENNIDDEVKREYLELIKNWPGDKGIPFDVIESLNNINSKNDQRKILTSKISNDIDFENSSLCLDLEKILSTNDNEELVTIKVTELINLLNEKKITKIAIKNIELISKPLIKLFDKMITVEEVNLIKDTVSDSYNYSEIMNHLAKRNQLMSLLKIKLDPEKNVWEQYYFARLSDPVLLKDELAYLNKSWSYLSNEKYANKETVAKINTLLKDLIDTGHQEELDFFNNQELFEVNSEFLLCNTYLIKCYNQNEQNDIVEKNISITKNILARLHTHLNTNVYFPFESIKIIGEKKYIFACIDEICCVLQSAHRHPINKFVIHVPYGLNGGTASDVINTIKLLKKMREIVTKNKIYLNIEINLEHTIDNIWFDEIKKLISNIYIQVNENRRERNIANRNKQNLTPKTYDEQKIGQLETNQKYTKTGTQKIVGYNNDYMFNSFLNTNKLPFKMNNYSLTNYLKIDHSVSQEQQVNQQNQQNTQLQTTHETITNIEAQDNNYYSDSIFDKTPELISKVMYVGYAISTAYDSIPKNDEILVNFDDTDKIKFKAVNKLGKVIEGEIEWSGISDTINKENIIKNKNTLFNQDKFLKKYIKILHLVSERNKVINIIIDKIPLNRIETNLNVTIDEWPVSCNCTYQNFVTFRNTVYWQKFIGRSNLPNTIKYITPEALNILHLYPQHFLDGLSIDNLPLGFYVVCKPNPTNNDLNDFVLCYDANYTVNKQTPLTPKIYSRKIAAYLGPELIKFLNSKTDLLPSNIMKQLTFLSAEDINKVFLSFMTDENNSTFKNLQKKYSWCFPNTNESNIYTLSKANELLALIQLVYEEGWEGVEDFLQTLSILNDTDSNLYLHFKENFLNYFGSYNEIVSLSKPKSLQYIKEIAKFNEEESIWWQHIVEIQKRQVGYLDLNSLYEGFQYFLKQLKQANISLPSTCPLNGSYDYMIFVTVKGNISRQEIEKYLKQVSTCNNNNPVIMRIGKKYFIYNSITQECSNFKPDKNSLIHGINFNKIENLNNPRIEFSKLYANDFPSKVRNELNELVFSNCTTPLGQLDRLLKILNSVNKPYLNPSKLNDQMENLKGLDFGTEGAWYAAKWHNYHYFHEKMKLSQFDHSHQDIQYDVSINHLINIDSKTSYSDAEVLFHRYLGCCDQIATPYQKYVSMTEALNSLQVDEQIKIALLPLLALATTGDRADKQHFNYDSLFKFILNNNNNDLLSIVNLLKAPVQKLNTKPTLQELTGLLSMLVNVKDKQEFIDKIFTSEPKPSEKTLNAWDAWDNDKNKISSDEFILLYTIAKKNDSEQLATWANIFARLKAGVSNIDLEKIITEFKNRPNYEILLKVFSSINLAETKHNNLPTLNEVCEIITKYGDLSLSDDIFICVCKDLNKTITFDKSIVSNGFFKNKGLTEFVNDYNDNLRQYYFDEDLLIDQDKILANDGIEYLEELYTGVLNGINPALIRVKDLLKVKNHELESAKINYEHLIDKLIKINNKYDSNFNYLKELEEMKQLEKNINEKKLLQNDLNKHNEKINSKDNIEALNIEITDEENLLKKYPKDELIKITEINKSIGNINASIENLKKKQNQLNILLYTKSLARKFIDGEIREILKKIILSEINQSIINYETKSEKNPLAQLLDDLTLHIQKSNDKIFDEAKSFQNFSNQYKKLFLALAQANLSWKSNLNLNELRKGNFDILIKAGKDQNYIADDIAEILNQLANNFSTCPQSLLEAIFNNKITDNNVDHSELVKTIKEIVALPKDVLSIAQKIDLINNLFKNTNTKYVNVLLESLEKIKNTSKTIKKYCFNLWNHPHTDQSFTENTSQHITTISKESEEFLEIILGNLVNQVQRNDNFIENLLKTVGEIKENQSKILKILAYSCFNAYPDKLPSEEDINSLIETLKICTNLDLIFKFYDKAPRPTYTALNIILKSGDIEKALTDFDLDPYGKRNNAQDLDEQFKMDSIHIRIDKIIDLKRNRPLIYSQRQKLYDGVGYITAVGRTSPLLIPQINSLANDSDLKEIKNHFRIDSFDYKKSVKDLTSIEIKSLFKFYQNVIGKNKLAPDQLWVAKLELIALMREAMYRIQGIMLYDTQIVSLLNIILQGGNVWSEIRTGEGKSLLVAFISVLKSVEKFSPIDVVSANNSLAVRDLKVNNDFYHYLGCKSNLIHTTSTYDEYQQQEGSIHYSTAPELTQWQQKQSLATKDLPDKITAIADEADSLALDDQVDFRISDSLQSSFVNNENPLKDIYIYILRFLESPEFKSNDDVSIDDIKRLRIFIEESDLEKNSKFLFKNLSAIFLYGWLTAANIAKNLKEGDHYEIADDINNEGKKKAVVKINHRRNNASEFSYGVHQFLHARLNREHKTEEFTINPEKFYIGSRGIKNFFDFYLRPDNNNEVRGELIGLSGSMGTEIDQEELTDHYNIKSYIIPPHQTSNRIPLNTEIARLNLFTKNTAENIKAAHFSAILNDILRARASNQSILVICESVAFSHELHEFIKHKLSKTDSLLQLYNGNQLDKTEEDVIRDAGKPGMITISTPMLGRGTNFEPKNITKDTKTGLAGLHVISTYIADDREYKQNIGRAARNGQIGSDKMILSCNEFLKRGRKIPNIKQQEKVIQDIRLDIAEQKKKTRYERQSFSDVMDQYFVQYIDLNKKANEVITKQYNIYKDNGHEGNVTSLWNEILKENMTIWSEFLQFLDIQWKICLATLANIPNFSTLDFAQHKVELNKQLEILVEKINPKWKEYVDRICKETNKLNHKDYIDKNGNISLKQHQTNTDKLEVSRESEISIECIKFIYSSKDAVTKLPKIKEPDTQSLDISLLPTKLTPTVKNINQIQPIKSYLHLAKKIDIEVSDENNNKIIIKESELEKIKSTLINSRKGFSTNFTKNDTLEEIATKLLTEHYRFAQEKNIDYVYGRTFIKLTNLIEEYGTEQEISEIHNAFNKHIKNLIEETKQVKGEKIKLITQYLHDMKHTKHELQISDIESEQQKNLTENEKWLTLSAYTQNVLKDYLASFGYKSADRKQIARNLIRAIDNEKYKNDINKLLAKLDKIQNKIFAEDLKVDKNRYFLSQRNQNGSRLLTVINQIRVFANSLNDFYMKPVLDQSQDTKFEKNQVLTNEDENQHNIIKVVIQQLINRGKSFKIINDELNAFTIENINTNQLNPRELIQLREQLLVKVQDVFVMHRTRLDNDKITAWHTMVQSTLDLIDTTLEKMVDSLTPEEGLKFTLRTKLQLALQAIHSKRHLIQYEKINPTKRYESFLDLKDSESKINTKSKKILSETLFEIERLFTTSYDNVTAFQFTQLEKNDGQLAITFTCNIDNAKKEFSLNIHNLIGASNKYIYCDVPVEKLQVTQDMENIKKSSSQNTTNKPVLMTTHSARLFSRNVKHLEIEFDEQAHNWLLIAK